MNGMDDEARRTLHILDEVSKNHRISQRVLSERLGVALGLTNLYLKRLIKKGFIKVKGIPGKRYLYYLTPTGFAEKSSLSIQYMQFSWNFFQDIRARWREQFQRLSGLGVTQVVLCGTNELAELAYLSLRESDLQVVAVVDNERAGSNFCGYTVEPVTALPGLHFDRVILAAAGVDPEAQAKLRDLMSTQGVPDSNVIGLTA
ncbi:MAG TPA: winged helix-turn-helix transcriptional regulator [Nitrospiria bacterium]|nr:winged helix-turn-helix transcriptional regulator [Nitrospiria bacterium]